MPSYKFRVLVDLKDSGDVFRDIVIACDDHFEAFYHAILGAFEFKGKELASFYVSNSQWDRGREIGLMEMGAPEGTETPSIMRETQLKDVVNSPRQRFILVHDFLRMWCFMIELVETLPQTSPAPTLALSVGTPPEESAKEFDFSNEYTTEDDLLLGNDIDDIFSEGQGDQFGDFENIDDMDI